jgi:hypothetical protein
LLDSVARAAGSLVEWAADRPRLPRGGRPRKWDRVWRIIKKHGSETGTGDDQAIANEHNKVCGSKLSNGKCKKIDAVKVKQIRYEYGNRKRKNK